MHVPTFRNKGWKCRPRPGAVKLPLFDRETSLTLSRRNRRQFIWLRRVRVRANSDYINI